MSKRPAALMALALAAWSGARGGERFLFFLELQGVAGYSSKDAKVVFHSLSPMDAMQKTSLGFDSILRISGRSRDIAAVAVQMRLAYDPGQTDKVELQVYNATVRFKTRFSDLWVGHSRPALGLSSVLDSHAELLPTLPMHGIGFDRDWGLGLAKDFSWGSGGVSLTSGSGMSLRLNGNWLAAGRIARGVLSRDGVALGLSAAYGSTLETMGTLLMSSRPEPFRCAGLDVAHLWRNVENRLEVAAGRARGEAALALFWRAGLGLLEEGRLKLEFQPVYLRTWQGRGWEVSAGASYQVTAHLTLRSMAVWDGPRSDRRFIFQAYYYRAL